MERERSVACNTHLCKNNSIVCLEQTWRTCWWLEAWSRWTGRRIESCSGWTDRWIEGGTSCWADRTIDDRTCRRNNSRTNRSCECWADRPFWSQWIQGFKRIEKIVQFRVDWAGMTKIQNTLQSKSPRIIHKNKFFEYLESNETEQKRERCV